MRNEKNPDEINTWLNDIKRSIHEIYDFLPAQQDFFSFQNDLKSRKAVERNIEIIGEAMDRILKADPNIQISHSRKIVDTRNRIIHGYDSVSDDVIWSIVTKYLPVLEKEVESLLD